MKTNKKGLRQTRGFTLIEVAIATTIAAAVATVGLYYRAQELRYELARSQADQLFVLKKALTRYQGRYASSLTSGTDIPGVANDLSPTIAELKALGLLDVSFSPVNLYSPSPNGYGTFIRVTGCPATCSVFGLSYLTTPLLDAQGRVDNASVGEAIAHGGGDIGATTELDTASIKGNQGMWFEPTPAPVSNKAGILAVRSGDGSADYPYVPLDGSTAMTGSLQMGTNSITGVGNLIASGTVSAGTVSATTVQVSGTVSATNVQATNNVSGANVNASNSMSTSVLTASDVTVNGTVYTKNGQVISNNGRQHIQASENLFLQPWSGGAVYVGGGGNTAGLNTYGRTSSYVDDWALVARNAAGQDNAQPQYWVGSAYVNDVYLRSVGRWASQGSVPWKLYQCPWDYALDYGGGDWASYGCVGQISQYNYCRNEVWGRPSTYRSCWPIN